MNCEKYIKIVLHELNQSIGAVNHEEMICLAKEIIKAKKIFCDGKGRSGLQAKSFVIRLAQMGLTSYEVSGVTTPAIEEGDLLIICSGSGKTPSLVEHAKTAKTLGAKVALVTGNRNSDIIKECACSVYIKSKSKGENSQYSVQPMGTLFEQSVGIIFDMIVLMLMEHLEITNEEMYKKHNNLE